MERRQVLRAARKRPKRNDRTFKADVYGTSDSTVRTARYFVRYSAGCTARNGRPGRGQGARKSQEPGTARNRMVVDAPNLGVNAGCLFVGSRLTTSSHRPVPHTKGRRLASLTLTARLWIREPSSFLSGDRHPTVWLGHVMREVWSWSLESGVWSLDSDSGPVWSGLSDQPGPRTQESECRSEHRQSVLYPYTLSQRRPWSPDMRAGCVFMTTARATLPGQGEIVTGHRFAS
ncbi:hypothetical protein BJ875DRAFT_540119 [Amylocarpus encephaloides]|uniref:Uncharacterized protein n=1 Tax=Amylocarpus encephaloides TaxID=45428 RepID=A0A9P7YR65_9HELO|nr:hypothetical protein BJ875DRAFT_540119 [Amylocarpus encephaloides]